MLIPGILIICGLLYFLYPKESSTTPQVEVIEPTQMSEQINNETQKVAKEDNRQQPSVVMVDVKGAVKQPGVYELNAESRVIDAITLAGGYAQNADSRLINHAQKITDEMVIYIPRKGEVMEEQVSQTLVTTPTQTTNGSSDSGGKVNINLADETALMTLPGIGPAKAKAIISYREENGNFKVIDDLKSVTGIGDKTFERLADAITVN